MVRFRIIRLAVVLILALTQTACMVTSENPLIAPESAKVDERLFGQWKRVEKDETAHYFIGRAAGITNCPEGLMVLHLAKIAPNHEIEWGEGPGYLFAAKVGKDDYLHLIERKDDSKKMTEWNKTEIKSYHILKYSIVDDRLVGQLMDLDVTTMAIEKGKLKGEVHRRKGKDNLETGEVQSVILKESSENLRKYLENGGSRTLFNDKEKTVLTRVKW